MKVKSYFEDVDRLIAKVKSATVTNKTRQAKFATLGCSSQPIVTRWESWLNVALFYAKKFTKVQAIVESLERSAVLVTQAKFCLQTIDLA